MEQHIFRFTDKIETCSFLPSSQNTSCNFRKPCPFWAHSPWEKKKIVCIRISHVPCILSCKTGSGRGKETNMPNSVVFPQFQREKNPRMGPYWKHSLQLGLVKTRSHCSRAGVIHKLTWRVWGYKGRTPVQQMHNSRANSWQAEVPQEFTIISRSQKRNT